MINSNLCTSEKLKSKSQSSGLNKLYCDSQRFFFKTVSGLRYTLGETIFPGNFQGLHCDPSKKKK